MKAITFSLVTLLLTLTTNVAWSEPVKGAVCATESNLVTDRTIHRVKFKCQDVFGEEVLTVKDIYQRGWRVVSVVPAFISSPNHIYLGLIIEEQQP